MTWLIARFASRWIGALRSESGRTAVTVAAIVLLLGVALLPVYRSPLVAGGDAVNVVRLFE